MIIAGNPRDQDLKSEEPTEEHLTVDLRKGKERRDLCLSRLERYLRAR